jgi:stress-induced morphogen
MAIKQEEIHKLLKEGFPDADIEINDLAGDDNHYAAKIKSSKFKGKTRVQQHQMVYASLKGKMGNELHALALTTEEKQYDKC